MTFKGKEYSKKFSWQKKWPDHGRTGRTADYGPATGVNPAGDAGDASPNILVKGTSTGISPNIITYFRI